LVSSQAGRWREVVREAEEAEEAPLLPVALL